MSWNLKHGFGDVKGISGLKKTNQNSMNRPDVGKCKVRGNFLCSFNEVEWKIKLEV